MVMGVASDNGEGIVNGWGFIITVGLWLGFRWVHCL